MWNTCLTKYRKYVFCKTITFFFCTFVTQQKSTSHVTGSFKMHASLASLGWWCMYCLSDFAQNYFIGYKYTANYYFIAQNFRWKVN